MNGDPAHTGITHSRQKIGQYRFGGLIIDADAAFDGHIDGHRPDHRRRDLGGAYRVLHQDRAESAGLDAVRGAADVQIDLIIAARGDNRGGIGQFCGIGAAELGRQRVFDRVIIQQMRRPAAHQRRSRDHFCVQQALARDLTVQKPAMPVCPVHHRRDGKPCGGQMRHARRFRRFFRANEGLAATIAHLRSDECR